MGGCNLVSPSTKPIIRVRNHNPPPHQQRREADGASLYSILMWLKYG